MVGNPSGMCPHTGWVTLASYCPEVGVTYIQPTWMTAELGPRARDVLALKLWGT